MRDMLLVTVLVENTVNIGGLRAEHGLAFLLRSGRSQILFDTGQSNLLVDNAGKMGLCLADLDAIVLSHGHYDHTGGLAAVRREASQARVFLHPEAVRPKYAGNTDGTSRGIGMSLAAVQNLPSVASGPVWTSKPTEVKEGVFVTGEIPRKAKFESTGGRFYLDADKTEPDPLIDDQALYFESSEGVVVLLGCAHAGVVNTLDYIRELTQSPIAAVIGGMHLLGADSERITQTISAFERLTVKRLVPAHCTGMAAMAQLWGAFPDCCSVCPVGTTLAFQR